MKPIEGGVCAPMGFTASGAAAGIKKAGSDRLDCCLVLSSAPASVAGTFTKNIMKSPSVFWNIDRVSEGTARAVFLNSGNANAATGQRGMDDVEATAEAIAKRNDLALTDVCICSTGVIGVHLPMDRILDGVTKCSGLLGNSTSLDAAKAMMTTDTVPKERAIEIELSDGTVRLGAIAKGSGMIAPNMATMDCFITTDASVDPQLLQAMTTDAVEVSFNQIGVDNDMSTSDTVLVLANGLSDTAALEAGSSDAALFSEALTALCQDMAKDIVRDGEGASKFVEITVRGAKNDDDAKSLARAVGLSYLCKTAFFGQDPNWGRIACAVGYAGVPFNPADLYIALDDVTICAGGVAADYTEEEAAAVMLKPEFVIAIRVGDGQGEATFWTSDLSHDYVSINADYRT